LAEIDAERAYWDEFANLIGWRITSWNRRSHASFVSPDQRHLQQITGVFRDAIMQAMKGKGEPN
jgi:hypothetical protein